ncbi:collagen alpha-1(II) chain-like [Panonychus citri]|uniref:collagen alpha-1(II) chain-like n=1 Tax=Panonychus citri TaxID=50023 RepID=UPI00230790ED|nr:collagen alpha-1(II) chain-like [Panonychus citri]
MNRSVFWISCEFFVLFCLCTCSLADDKVNDTSITKRLGLVNYLFPEPSELLSPLLPSSPLRRSSVNGHWVFPQSSRNGFSIASLIPGGTTMDLAESVPRFSYSRFIKDGESGSGLNDTQATNSSSAYAEYGRRNGGSPGSVVSSANNNQQMNRDSNSGQQRSDRNDDVDIDAELKAADKVVESAIDSGANNSPSSTPGPLDDGRGFRRPGMRPLRAFRPGQGGPGGPFEGPYGPYREMRGLSGNGGHFGPIRGLAGGPGLWSPSAFPFSGRPRVPFAMGMKSGLGLNEFNEGGRGSPMSMNPHLWNEIDALTASGSNGANGAVPSGSFDLPAFPLSGLSGEGYPLLGGPTSLGLYPLTPAASSTNGQLHPSASTAHGQVLPSPLQGVMGAPGLHGSLPGSGLPGLVGGLPGGLNGPAPGSSGSSGAPGAPGASGASGAGDSSNLADLQKAHPGLHPEQYKYLQQWYSYLNQPSIKSYVDSFRDSDDPSSSSAKPSSSSSSPDANKEGNRPWFRNLRLFPNMDMTRLQLPRVRDIFRNIGTRLGSSTASTSTTTESSADPFNV